MVLLLYTPHSGGPALPLDSLSLFDWHPFAGSETMVYLGFVALLTNILVAVVVTLSVRPGFSSVYPS